MRVTGNNATAAIPIKTFAANVATRLPIEGKVGVTSLLFKLPEGVGASGG